MSAIAYTVGVTLPDAAAVARLQSGQDRTDISLVHTEDQGLLRTLGIQIPNRDEMLARFAEQQDRGDQDGSSIPAADVLPVLHGVDLAVGNSQVGLPEVEEERLPPGEVQP